MSAWLLPESVADVLPSEARRIEDLRRNVLDAFRTFGYELVMPPMLEYTESLLGQADASLDLQTFKLLDQASGRMLGLRADITPQVARIDAHILNRKGATRLCYCGPVLHTKARGLHTTREPIQCGAELYGCAGLEADLEIISLAAEVLALSGLPSYRIAFSHAGLLRAVLGSNQLSTSALHEVHQALAFKDKVLLGELLKDVPADISNAVLAIADLYGKAAEVIGRARKVLPATPAVSKVLNELVEATEGLASTLESVPTVILDLADMASFDYHSGLIFSAYCNGCPNPILRGGRYDDVGQVYGRARPATGFSVDLRELVSLAGVQAAQVSAIRAPWGTEPSLMVAIRGLRSAGEVVVQTLPNMVGEEEEFVCDRELVAGEQGGWQVVQLRNTGEGK